MGRYTTIIWNWGGLAESDLLGRVIHRCLAHKIADRAALLSFYFLVALFPLLIVLSNLIGFLIAGVMALLFWLYVFGAALVVGGELNAVIWHATSYRS